MHLEGSCSCGAVRFSLECAEPYPFMRCYCSICRKTSGGGGYSINLGGKADSLQVQGREHTRVYSAMLERKGKRIQSRGERHFCSVCGSHLWAFDPKWPELVHPIAGAIDTPLPTPPSSNHIMLGSKAPWVEVAAGPDDGRFDVYPDASLADWHAKRGLTK